LNDGSYSPNVWSFNLTTSVWNRTALSLLRYGHCIAQNGTMIYVVGGVGNDAFSLRSLNLTAVPWTWNTTYPALPTGHKYFPACGIWNDTVVVFGGCENPGSNCGENIELFNTTTHMWDTVTNTMGLGPSPRQGATMNVFKNDTTVAVIVGGTPLNGTANIFLYQFENKTWIPISAGLPDLSYHTATITVGNRVLIFGGEEPSKIISSTTYVLSVTDDSVTSQALTFNASEHTPSPRFEHGAVYSHNRMLLYGGEYTEGESSSTMWQLVVETECREWMTCGECLLASCYWCNPNGTTFCVAGAALPYIPSTCTFQGWNVNDIVCCRRSHPTSMGLVVATIIILVAIAILVVATYIVDWKKGKASSGGYEPIMGI